jgi:TetR/AcrR family transcriptional regulator, cholesterol catabolism regulator
MSTSTSASTSTNEKKGRKQADRRGELIRIAAHLFAQKGFKSTTIRDIADAAGIQSGSLYYHFDSKESMVEELIEHYWTTLLANYREVGEAGLGATETARGLIRASVLLLDECELALRLMLNDWTYLSEIFPIMQERLDECRAIWLDTLDRGIASEEFRSSIEPIIAYRTIMSSINGTARWFRPGGSLTVQALADEMSAVFLDGVVARP